MYSRRWALALPFILAASISSTHASTIRDSAGMFSPDAVRQGESRLDQLEQESKIPVTIETIETLEGRDVTQALRERAKQSGAKGLYVLIAKQPPKIDVQSSAGYAKALTKARNQDVMKAFIQELKKRDFNAALNSGIEAIEKAVAEAKAEGSGAIRAVAPAAPGGPAQRARPGVPAIPGGAGGFNLSSLLGIGLLILAVLFGIRLLGSLFGGRNRGYAGPQQMGGPGPGYGAPGYGGGMGGGGGFMSSMFGGIGGALAGNWLYDQFSGRSHGGGHVDQGAMGGGATGAGEAGADWGGSAGGADWGGDAGVGDVGGGGDWGGGGGDIGGGDWSGGGGGGDWGGGGDGGGGGDW